MTFQNDWNDVNTVYLRLDEVVAACFNDCSVLKRVSMKSFGKCSRIRSRGFRLETISFALFVAGSYRWSQLVQICWRSTWWRNKFQIRRSAVKHVEDEENHKTVAITIQRDKSKYLSHFRHNIHFKVKIQFLNCKETNSFSQNAA